MVRPSSGGLDERPLGAAGAGATGLGVPAPLWLHAPPPAPPACPSRCRRSGGFSQSLAARVEALQRAHPEATVQLWAEDEHRVGLKPILRRVWARRGQPLRAFVRPRYEWEYVYGFVQPETGATHWLLMPTVNIAAFTSALAHFAEQVGAGPTKQILLVVDQAGWHSSPQVDLPSGVHLELLPSYSPELQPAERLWPLTNEPLANRAFDTLTALDTVVADQCVRLADQPTRVRAQTLFHWWPRLAPMPEAFSRS